MIYVHSFPAISDETQYVYIKLTSH